uniref:Putative tick mucins 1 n=1 Tax=Amblyomma cajennense TaxID=34607 RepID=A0A023FT16_AMBCJ
MQAKVVVPVFVVVAVVAAAGVPLLVPDDVVCPIVDDKGSNATLFHNKYNCSTFYLCAQGVPELIPCPAGLHFNSVLNVCDYPSEANCIEVEPAVPEKQDESTTLNEQPATEKIIITQVVKEIIKPAEDPAAAA